MRRCAGLGRIHDFVVVIWSFRWAIIDEDIGEEYSGDDGDNGNRNGCKLDEAAGDDGVAQGNDGASARDDDDAAGDNGSHGCDDGSAYAHADACSGYAEWKLTMTKGRWRRMIHF